jgi:hypothetical protein
MKAALAEGVLYVPGQFCYVNGGNGPVPTGEIRLSFGVAPPQMLREGIKRLARAANKVNCTGTKTQQELRNCPNAGTVRVLSPFSDSF